ncbi:MAG: DUF3135 domain-containing protein [Gammaproteobacteria bacterium]|nr:DUF3135 domain-containing protein [Gammaproteobacteria bacterium]
MTKAKSNRILKYQDDFDFWARLARRNPERFERLRSQMIAEFLNTAPEEKRIRLQRVQWRVDQARKLARNPVDSLNRISRLMWDELMTLNSEQKRLINIFCGDGSKTNSDGVVKSAAIMPFRKRDSEE